MSIWTSIDLPDGREAKCGDESDSDEYGDRNPRDHTWDVAVAYEQIRICLWPDLGRQGNKEQHLDVLMLPSDVLALRDLLDCALQWHAQTNTRIEP